MSAEQELEALFRAERAASPAAEAVKHGWQRLASDLAANVAPLPVSTGALKLSAWLIPKWLLLGFTVGLVGAGATAPLLGVTEQPHVRPRPPPARLVTAIASTQPSAPVPSASAEQPPLSPVAGGAGQALRAAPAAPAAAVASSAATAPTLDVQLKLIALAKGELDAHRPLQAQAWLTEYEQRFPNGVFAVEREALAIIARCQQGPRDLALAHAFAKHHPGSPLAARLERSCSARGDFSNSANGAAELGEPMTAPTRGDEK